MHRSGIKSLLIVSASIVFVVGSALFLSSCVPSFPKEKLPETIKEVCRIEYEMTVDVALSGSTLGIYYPMKGLLDVNLGISKEAWDKISNLILVASRVVLSTDADVKFYCVITQDEKLPEMQVVVIKYVDDIKRGMYRNISRDESFKRTLFSVNLTPQARKERAVEKVFNKLGLEEKTRESVLNEFFRSAPSKLSDVGYWREHFYLKDISMEEFLVAQIVNRIKIDFRRDEELKKLYSYRSAEGDFYSEKDKKFFLIKFKIADQQVSDEEINLREKKIEEIVRIANLVVTGYKFKNFDFMEMEDLLANVKLWVSSSDIYNFNEEDLPIKDIVKTSAKYF